MQRLKNKEAKIECDLIIHNAWILTQDIERREIRNGYVIVVGNQIQKIGSKIDLTKYKSKKIIDAKGNALLPGLINTHCHATHSIFRGFADDMPLLDWLHKFIFPLERKFISPEVVYWASLLSCIEMIKFGTTCFYDAFYFENEVAKACFDIKMRGVLGQTIIDFPAPDAKTPEEGFQYFFDYYSKWKKHDLITPSLFPHSQSTVAEAYLKEIHNIAMKENVLIGIHLSESKQEVDEMTIRLGKAPIHYLDSFHFFDTPVLAAHCIYLTENEIRVLKKKNVGIAHNPESNFKVCSGVAPIPKLLKQGLPVSLGTDGPATKNNLDLFDTMRFAALIHKWHAKDATVVNAKETLDMVTINASKSLFMEASIGSIVVGKKADMIIVDLSAPHLTPCYNLYSQLVYSAMGSDVDTTIINGQVVMLNRKIMTLDEENVISEVNRLAKKLLKLSKSK